VKRKKASRSDRVSSDLREINIFIGLTLIIFFGAVGFPTLINTSPSFGYEGINFTPVTSAYQEAFAQEQTMNVLANYYFNPMISSAFLVMPNTLDLPPPDFDQYFQLKYNQIIEFDYGFIPFETIKELLSPETYFPSAYANHLDTTNSTTWNLREHDVNVGGSPIVDVTTNATDNSLVIAHTGTIGSFVFFKSFDSNFLDGQTISFTWKSFEGGTDFTPSVVISDGEYDRTNSTEFPEDTGRLVKGAGTLTNCIGEPSTPISLSTYSCLIDASTSTEGNATIFLSYDTNFGINELNIHVINVTNFGIWNYTDSHTIDYTATGSDSDNGEVSSTFTIAPVTKTITDVAVAVDQVTVKKQFIPIDNLEVYWKFDHITPTFVSEFINSTDWNVTGTRITPTNSSTSGHLEVRQVNIQDGIHAVGHQLSGNADDTSWVLRFPILQATELSEFVFGATLQLWYGIANTDETVSVRSIAPASDSIGITVQYTTVEEVDLRSHFSDESFPITNNLALALNIGSDPRYMEIIRNNATSVTWNVYNDTGYTVLFATHTRTIPSTVDVMNFIKIGYDDTLATNTGNFDYNVDNVKFWNATTDIHNELHTEDFANINDADQVSDNAIVNKTEIGIIGNAWQTSPTNDQTNVTIGGVKTDWNFVVNADTTYNFWTTQADPVIGSDQGFLFSTINHTATPDIGDTQFRMYEKHRLE